MITDDELSAFLDGELDAVRARQIDDAAAADPHLAARIERLRSTDGAVNQAFASLLDRPGGDALEAAIRAAEARAEGAAQPAASNVVDLAARRRPSRAWAWPSSIAATLVVGILAGRAVSPPAGDWVADPASGAPAAGKQLAAALSTTGSGKPFTLRGGRTGRVTLTFASQTGSLCRAFEVDSGGARRGALACRGGGPAWTLVAMAPATPSGGDFQTASGPGDDPVSAMVDRMILGEPLDAAHEAAALRRLSGQK